MFPVKQLGIPNTGVSRVIQGVCQGFRGVSGFFIEKLLTDGRRAPTHSSGFGSSGSGYGAVGGTMKGA